MYTHSMNLEIDPDVKATLAFMQRNVPAARLVAVAEAAAKIASIIWGQYETEDIAALRLQEEPISAGDPRTRRPPPRAS